MGTKIQNIGGLFVKIIAINLNMKELKINSF